MRVNPKDLFTKTELEMTNGMVAKAERNNKYDIRLNPKCRNNGRSAGNFLSLIK